MPPHPLPLLARLAVLSPLPLNNDALFSQAVSGHFLALFIRFISCLSGPCAWHPNKGRENGTGQDWRLPCLSQPQAA